MRAIGNEKVGVMTNVRRKGKFKRMAMDFSLKDEGKKYVLFAKEGENCDCHDGGLNVGLHASPYRTDDSSTHTCSIQNVKNLFILRVSNLHSSNYWLSSPLSPFLRRCFCRH